MHDGCSGWEAISRRVNEKVETSFNANQRGSSPTQDVDTWTGRAECGVDPNVNGVWLHKSTRQNSILSQITSYSTSATPCGLLGTTSRVETEWQKEPMFTEALCR